MLDLSKVKRAKKILGFSFLGIILFIIFVPEYKTVDEVVFVCLGVMYTFAAFLLFYSRDAMAWIFGIACIFMFIYLALKGIGSCGQVEAHCLSILNLTVPIGIVMAFFAIYGAAAGIYWRVLARIDKSGYKQTLPMFQCK